MYRLVEPYDWREAQYLALAMAQYIRDVYIVHVMSDAADVPVIEALQRLLSKMWWREESMRKLEWK